MPDPTTPPPLDDREKVAHGLAEHESNWQSDGDYCERTWIECRCGETWDVPTIEQEWEAARRHQADAVLAVLNLPTRDRKNLAQGWNEGYEQAVRSHCDADQPCDIYDPNPYHTQEDTTMEHCDFCETDVDSVSTAWHHTRIVEARVLGGDRCQWASTIDGMWVSLDGSDFTAHRDYLRDVRVIVPEEVEA